MGDRVIDLACVTSLHEKCTTDECACPCHTADPPEVQQAIKELAHYLYEQESPLRWELEVDRVMEKYLKRARAILSQENVRVAASDKTWPAVFSMGDSVEIKGFERVYKVKEGN